ncbi:thiol-disulfide oxidoreductase ResA [bacterium BMS3Bbin14]|nr:thiol-disulfide oxidoreductase ResA [bacterium BMS3Abin13]GBE52776.1 thiol-disulfide oxidoreductase ResA [bacterium BMS3Bbin14]HDK43400.1 TlpA family protein disulfide reductase [Desulfobacteraceae bacterium]HDL98766.1 TlpA family protein disulfide reductase [Desulfobacteraceae bacterium]HDO29523.1 TlpA family protein disulfide reductase [Desulfobacteraceae bacterium]
MKYLQNKSMKKTGLIFFGLVVLVMSVTVAGASTRMPPFALSSAVGGQTVSSAAFKGKVLLVTFFATWCPPCRQEIPNLIQLNKKFGPQGFSVIALSVDQGGPGVVAKLVKKENINYPVLMSTPSTTRDFGGIVGIPTAFLINRAGNVVKRYPGYTSRALLEKDIQSVLQ